MTKPQNTCEQCEVLFDRKNKNQKTCSEKCRVERVERIWGRDKTRLNLPTPTAGALAEMYVSAFLMELGFSVFRALSPACFCDLIAHKNNKTYRVEVRTGYTNIETGVASFPKNTHGEIDLFGVYEKNTNKVNFYEPISIKNITEDLKKI